MSKYDALGGFLCSQKTGRWTVNFKEVEKILGFKLPQSARKYQAWWANEEIGSHVQAKSWLSAGWITSDLDLALERITFEKKRDEISISHDTFIGSAKLASLEGEIRLRLRWIKLGNLYLDRKERLKFPNCDSVPSVYRFRISSNEETEYYIGETDNLARRFQHYRTPGPSQMTNIRLSQNMVDTLKHDGAVTVDLMDTRDARKKLEYDRSAFENKYVRRMYESAAILQSVKQQRVILNC